MLFTVIFILLLIWAAVVGSIYSNFLVFFDNFEETQNYNKAYYEAIAALERAELAIKQRNPGYEWSGWWIWTEFYSNTSPSDKRPSDFSYISNNQYTTLFRTINSLTNRMPAKWKWNVDYMLATWDSIDYNMMDYQNSEIVLLNSDNSEDWPYNKDSRHTKKVNINNISWVIRLPEKIKPKFWLLDTSHELPGNIVQNDAIVDRQINWVTNGNDFTIFARQDVIDRATIGQNDSAIRESDLNNWVILKFWDNTSTPLEKRRTAISSGFVVVSSNTGLTYEPFKNIFNMWNNIQLKLSLLNVLQGQYWVYPFLEYYLNFDKETPDKFYTIKAEWRFGDFQINLLVKKPTIKQSVLWSFTVVF